VSGAVLEYTHPRLESLAAVTGFYVKRLSRIYPAFWMSLIIALTYAPALLRSLQPHILLLEFTGFCAFTGRWSGVINPIAWFIGLIVVLYFLFPFLSASIRERPFLMLFLIAVIEISARYFFHVWYIPELGRWPDKWLPVCNFLEFGLGIWIVQNGFYPKWVHDSRVIGFLAEISFYVFLIHEVGGIFAMSKVSLPAYVIAVGLLSWLMMLGDQGVQVWLKKRLCVIRPEPQR
jgi:peptidoglycan/LPS O-acetylase OafA/YrhL